MPRSDRGSLDDVMPRSDRGSLDDVRMIRARVRRRRQFQASKFAAKSAPTTRQAGATNDEKLLCFVSTLSRLCLSVLGGLPQEKLVDVRSCRRRCIVCALNVGFQIALFFSLF
jgi:hypothetical protein